MTPGRIRIGSRRAGALAAIAVGIVGFWLVTRHAGGEWGLVLLAAVAGPGSAGAALTYREQRRQARLRPYREQLETRRWQELQAELRQLQRASARDQAVAAGQLEALARTQRQAQAAYAWRAARRDQDAAGCRQIPGQRSGPGPERRDEELALLRGCDLFDPDWYQAQLRAPLADPVAHYLDWGVAHGLDPHPRFDSGRYLERFPDALARWQTPLGHWVATGQEAVSGFPCPAVRYDRHGNPDQADLDWQYLVRGLHREPDTFVLYRIIGNDLPPRHRTGQGIENLRFILEHEPDLPGCQKRWVVNRIVDPRTEKQIIATLEEHGRPYLHIPFEADHYRRVGWRFADLEPPGLTYRREFQLLSPGQRRQVLDHVYHFKNLYVMNNNGARNAALREGRGLAKWVLPWDGNCFLTRHAWDELVAGVSGAPHLKYFTVPMARILDNRVLLRPAPTVTATEEPQLVFRRDAAEEFNSDARYGRRPKVDLFYRLEIPGPWDGWGRIEWDDPPLRRSAEARQVGQAGWVARLFSGEETAESDSADRQRRRVEAIQVRIDAVDRELAQQRYDPSTLLVRDERVLERQRGRWADREPGPRRVVAALVAEAERALRTRRPGAPQAVIHQVSVLTLAGWFTKQQRFLDHGARLLRRGWLRRRSRFTVAGARDLDSLLDAARLLEREAALSPADTQRLRQWCGRYRTWLLDSGPGEQARMALDHRGTWYDLQLAALDGYLGEIGGLLATLRRASERVGQQLGSGNELGSGLEQVTPYHLLGWLRLARCAGRLGRDLWSGQGTGDAGLTGAVRSLLGSPGPDDRLPVIAHLARASVDSKREDPWQVRQVFDPESGVMPFWVLGTDVGR